MATEQGKRVTFVTPYSEEDRPLARMERLEPAQIGLLPSASQSMVEVRGTFTDRANGFQIASVPLAVGVGLGSLIVGIVGWGVPFFSVAALAWLWTGFLLTWFGAWVVHNLFSGDGIALLQAMLGYRYLRHEQKARLARWASIHEEGKRRE